MWMVWFLNFFNSLPHVIFIFFRFWSFLLSVSVIIKKNHLIWSLTKHFSKQNFRNFLNFFVQINNFGTLLQHTLKTQIVYLTTHIHVLLGPNRPNPALPGSPIPFHWYVATVRPTIQNQTARQLPRSFPMSVCQMGLKTNHCKNLRPLCMSVQSWHTRRSPTPWTLLLTLAQHPIKAGIHGFSPLLSHPVPVNKTENPHVAFNDWPHRKSSRFPQVHRIRYWNENCFPFISVNFPTRSPTPPTRVRLPRGLQANSGSYYVWKFFFYLILF